MLKIYNPNISSQQIGGGWTFRRNLEVALKDRVEFVPLWQDCDTFLISSVTLVDKSEVFNAKGEGKKIVLRVDNMPRKSRNKMSPHERMKEFADMADEVVYQSKWAQEWIGSYLGKEGRVIYNSVDENVFKPKIREPNKTFIIVQYNRDENKRIPEALDMFTKKWLEDKECKLLMVGNFSPDLVAANFDFFRGEQIKYLGVQSDPKVMATMYHQADTLIFPVYSDACPNTVIEAMMCGLDILHTGWCVLGELYEKWEAGGREYFSLPRMAKEYLEVL